MKILFVTCHLPYPPHSGGRLREHQLLARLTQRFEVHIAAVSKTLAEDRAAVADIPWEHDGVSLFAAAQLAGITGVAPQVARHRSEAATAGVGDLLARGRFDVVHVEGFYVWQHLARTRLPTVLVEQNIEWQLFDQQGRLEEAAVTRAAELAVWRQAAVLGAVTEEDRSVMEERTGRPAHLIPDGADHLAAPGHAWPPGPGRSLLMVGNYGYAPNVDGALWLASEVLPRIRAVLPDVRLRLVGASPPREVRALEGEAIEVTGRVPDVAPYIDDADVVVCPLRFGGGVKVKVLEALTSGKAIVSTEIGC
ncbi:MAG TPA: glycosyltransferase family 4 protein, partial [Thermoleophilaceae bacterium]|nr:glycosyltransferase family 4 protein [Thermoleophilaceae bacterium]